MILNNVSGNQCWILRQLVKDILLHRFTPNQMLCDNSVQHRLVDMMVPNAIGIDNEQWSVITDTQAGRNPTFDTQRIFITAQLTQLARQAVVKLVRLLFWITILARADKNVAGIRCLAGCIVRILIHVFDSPFDQMFIAKKYENADFTYAKTSIFTLLSDEPR